jgi:hypothetical protein
LNAEIKGGAHEAQWWPKLLLTHGDGGDRQWKL